MNKRIDRRFSEELVFQENQFNFAFEFIKYGNNDRFEPFVLSKEFATLKAKLNQVI